MKLYKTPEGKRKILSLYDSQIERLGRPFKDIWVDTSFGKTHLIETGNFEGIPLLLFHGGNITTAYNLLECDYLMDDFHIYAVDTIGHPGKSAEVNLSAYNYDYGKWAGQVITQLGYESIRCFGGSFGAGIIVKTMCIDPERVKGAVLYVPSAINNASPIGIMNMMWPMLLYLVTHKDTYLKKCLLPMALSEDNISEDIFQTSKLSITYTKIKSGMPSNVSTKLMKECETPTLIMAAEKDCLFPADKVLSRAQKIFRNATLYLLKGRGHMNTLTDQEKQMIVDFLKKK